MRRDSRDKKIAIVLIVSVFMGTIILATLYFNRGVLGSVKAAFLHDTIDRIAGINPKASDKLVAVNSAPATAQSAITKEPPKHATTSKSTESTTKNPDGGKTVTLCESGTCAVANNPNSQPNGNSPYSIKYSDQTGNYPTLEKTLKDYLSSQLKWGNEISYMYQITVQNAGDTGWEGQYVGSYTMNASGKIVSASGSIVLNVYYHKDSPQFNDYMKLVLSHEYGHHYTLYHKWMDMNLPSGVRFPDSYYSVRPLPKSTTAPDYSLGWGNCDSEIMAEDYSYIYSGYGYHAMSGTYGYPSAATKTWLENLTAGQSTVTPPPVQNPDATPPSVSITDPANNSNLTGTVSIKASASDDVGVTKVDFYVNESLVAEDTSAPYETQINTQAYSDGAYTLTAVAFDSRQNSQSSVSVNFVNNQTDTGKPVVTISNPTDNPHTWTSGDLLLEARATDDRSVVKMEFYVGDRLLATQNGSYIGIRAPWFDGYAADYIFKAKAYDAAGNVGEATITVSKE